MKNYLKNIRIGQGFTLENLSKMTGISKGYLCDLEKGKNKPTLRTAYALCNVLSMSVYDIWPDTTEIVEETITIRRVKFNNEGK